MKVISHPKRTETNHSLENRAKKRRAQRAALFCSVLLVMLAGWLWLEVWPLTVRREAYLPELEAMTLRWPYDGPLLSLTGARQIDAHEYGPAIESLRRAAAAGENDPEVWLNMAAAFDAQGERAQALAMMRLALEAQPNNAQLQAAVARIAQIPVPAPAGALAPAFAPNGPQAIIDANTRGSFLNGLAQWWGHRNPEQSGTTTRRLWAAQEPQNAFAQRLWGQALLRNRRPLAAADVLRHAIALEPENDDAHLSMATAQEDLGQTTAAALEYIEVLKIQRDSLPALLGLGRALQKGGRIGSAVRSFRRATKVAPDSLEAWTSLGRATQLSGVGYDQSVEAYEKALQLAPDDMEFLNDYAISLDRLSKQEKAEAVLRQRLKIAPNDALSHYLLGMVLMNSNPTPERIEESEKHTREALQLNPGNPLASIQLAQLLFQQNKQSDEALALLKDATQRDPFNRNSQLLLAGLYRRRGEKKLADQTAAAGAALFKNQQLIADLEEKERDGKLPNAERQRLINLYVKTGQNDKAERQRQIIAVLKTNPQSTEHEQLQFKQAVDEVLGKPQSPIEED